MISGNLLIFGLIKLARLGGLCLQFIEHGDHCLSALFGGVPLIHDGVGPEQVRILGEIAEACGLHGDLIFVNQRLVQAAAFASGQDVRG